MNTIPSKKSLKKITKVAQLLKVVSHPVRLQIIEALGQQEALTVSEIKKAIGITVEQSMLSHHLIKMKDSGVLTSEKKGKYNYYRLSDRQILKVLE
ncbi:ArsR/SmtB family transcription factor [Flavicella sediminum]|uniref:ArsR/SmtB family transcription factor n=1 Tax=Flavicella sediminum TaxID=2585141 RepID=UPI00111CA351|nr:metalloregulator ArsR/SmtB family transcription factor [Flavicella sediminum]